MLKATKVDGVYSADPEKDPTAERYTTLTYSEALSRSLKVMDAAAFSLCMENHIPIVVFNFFESGSIEGVVQGKKVSAPEDVESILSAAGATVVKSSRPAVAGNLVTAYKPGAIQAVCRKIVKLLVASR